MSFYSKVLWSEGLFLRPQHFQQQERYLEHYVEGRVGPLRPGAWGLVDFELERDQLAIGKFSLRRASGVYPDGTPFRMPDDDPLPAPLEIGTDVRDQIVYLSLPLRRAGAVEADRAERPDGLVRNTVRQESARDIVAGADSDAVLEISLLRARLTLQRDPADGYARIPIAHILERRPEAQVVLEERFIATVLNTRAADRLQRFLTELQGYLQQRGDELAERAVATGRAASAEIADFLLLQSVNRYQPLITHFATAGTMHPEAAFQLLREIAGDLSTLLSPKRRPAPFQPYQHDNLRASFEPLILELRDLLSFQQQRAAVAIPIKKRQFGYHKAEVGEKALFDAADFVLSIRCAWPADQITRYVPQLIKIAPVEIIEKLVQGQLPGVPLIVLPAAPRQLNYVTGAAYFQLDRTGPLWPQLKASAAMAIHAPTEIPDLAMELWAIRGNR